jgi:multiple sugar transport system ATP-binding protein
MAAFLEVDQIVKRFGAVEVLKAIDIRVEDGEFLVLVGPSGCGKSTLLNTIAGLESVTEGELRIAGRRVNELHPKDRDIAMVFQSYALYPNMNVEQNISFGMEMRGVPKAERAQAVHEVARLLQIEQLLKRRPSQLSGGQRQRVAMGRALVRKPKIFLFDEPLSNLDAKLRVEMRTEIKKLHQRLGATIVYVTHDQIEAMTLATRIAVMRGGVLQQLGTPREVYDQPANVFVAGFMGSPSMNLIPASVVEDSGGLAVTVQREDAGALRLPIHDASNGAAANGRARDYLGREVILGLRPEAITDPRDAEAHTAHHHPIECLVEVTEPTGPDTLAVLRLGGIEATARLRADSDARPDHTSAFMVDMAKAVLFDPATEARI